jgi:serine/threonine protein kinase
LAKGFSHPNLLRYHGTYQNETHIAVITDYLSGQNFREYLVKQPEKRISEQEARNYFKQILSVIDYLLRHNVIHRNINLRNIFIDRNQLKVGDFLITNKIKPIYKPHSDTSSYHFYAPECWLDEGQIIDVSSDVWALGMNM